MAKSKAAQQDSAENDTAAESPAEQTNPASSEAIADEFLAAPGDSDESTGDAKGDNKTEKSPYPEGTKLFTYKPKGKGSKAIQMPLEFDHPDKVWLWKLHRLPFLNQTWAWMDKANVPDSVQLQVVSLNDDEYPDLFNQWFEAMGGGATPGE